MKKRKDKIIKIPYKLFEYNLKASSFRVYIYLSSIAGGWWKNRVCVKLATISERCNISINTAQRCVNELAEKKLIKKTVCFKDHRRTTNEYSVSALDGYFTVIECNVFFSLRDNSAFMTMCGIAVSKDNSGEAFPSLNKIHKRTGLSVPTIVEDIKHLNEHGYTLKKLRIGQKGCNICNQHWVFKLAFRAFLMWYIVKSDTINQLLEAIRHTAKFIGFDCSTLTTAGTAALMFTIVLIFIAKHFGEVNTC